MAQLRLDDCVPWAGYCRPDGYGVYRINGKPLYAHRLVYTGMRGPIPEGMDVHHECRNPSCVNPDHLAVLPLAEHRVAHLRQPRRKKSHCSQGHEYTPENTAIRSDGFRQCITCHKAKSHRNAVARWARKKALRLT